MGVPLSKLRTAAARYATTTPSHTAALSTALQPAHPVPPSIHDAETLLLSQLSQVRYEKRAVRLPSGHVLNTISAGQVGKPTLVVVHGWGSGVGFFGRNIEGLAADFRVHFIDWLGFGASSRPQHPLTFRPVDAENFFIEALAEWVGELEALERDLFKRAMAEEGDRLRDVNFSFAPFHLCGHSMGAYLSVAFSLRYPEFVKNLVLASPVGLPKAPANKMPPPTAPVKKRLMFWVIFALWERGWTPQTLVRIGGARIGRRVSSWMITPRFPADTELIRDAFVEYFYQISSANPSGEHSLSTILESGAYARRPLCDRMSEVAVPVVFLYGDRDWMNRELAEKLRVTMKVKVSVEVVEDAGHHLYYDNADAFNRIVRAACLGE